MHYIETTFFVNLEKYTFFFLGLTAFYVIVQKTRLVHTKKNLIEPPKTYTARKNRDRISHLSDIEVWCVLSWLFLPLGFCKTKLFDSVIQKWQKI